MVADDPDNTMDPYITEEQYAELSANQIVLVDQFEGQDDTAAVSSGVTSYYVDTVIRDVTADLMEANNWTEDYADSQLRNGGYRIYTCVDQDMQTYLEDKFNDWTTFSSSQLSPNENGEIPEAAMVIMDYEGRILALVGGKGEKTNTLSLTAPPRRPGPPARPSSRWPAMARRWSTT